MKCIVSYYPSTNKVHSIYNSVEEAKSDVRFLNVFGKMSDVEQLRVGVAELTDDEYKEYCGG